MKQSLRSLNLVRIPLLQPSPVVAVVVLSLSVVAPLSARAAGRLVWSDEFDGTSINSNHWRFETGNRNGWGNHELEFYTDRPENTYVRDGLLHIVARKESFHGFAYTSARIKTQGLFARKYGRFEFRARVPEGQGYWPALWLMPENSIYGRWPDCGEVDVMETKGSNPGVVQGSIHYARPNGGHLQSTALYTFSKNNGATNFHTYVIEWTTNQIQWFVDGTLYETQTNWSTAKAPYPAPFNQPFYIIMNLAVGGEYGGNPDDTTVFPGELQVDYVRVYDETRPGP